MPGGVESQAAAEEYLTKHNVVKIFERLSTALLYAKPADPLSFLQQEVRKLQEAQKKGEAAVFFSDQDLRAMFSMFDPTGTGFISKEQMSTAIQNLGLARPVESAKDRIDVNTFVEVASKALRDEKFA